jgi:hypothetical protein
MYDIHFIEEYNPMDAKMHPVNNPVTSGSISCDTEN